MIPVHPASDSGFDCSTTIVSVNIGEPSNPYRFFSKFKIDFRSIFHLSECHNGFTSAMWMCVGWLHWWMFIGAREWQRRWSRAEQNKNSTREIPNYCSSNTNAELQLKRTEKAWRFCCEVKGKLPLTRIRPFDPNNTLQLWPITTYVIYVLRTKQLCPG
jgi:hypothetical protein